MPIKTVAIEASSTLSVQRDNTSYTVSANAYAISIGQDIGNFNIDYASYEWNVANYVPVGSAVLEIEIIFPYNNVDNTNNIEIIALIGSVKPSNDTAESLWTRINADELIYTSYNILNAEKSYLNIDLSDSKALVDESVTAIGNLQYAVDNKSWFAVGIRRKKEILWSAGSIEVGGSTLKKSYGWESAGSNMTDPPLLLVTFDTSNEDSPLLDMRYTTSEPLSNQNSPSNSIGGYLSFNSIYRKSFLGDSISSVQKFLPILSTADLPSRTGLATFGTEVVKYDVIDSSEHQLLTVTRGISPLSSFPGGFDDYGNPEPIYFLHPDSVSDEIKGTVDLHRLFDKSPSHGLTHYRCVTIFHTGTGSSVNFNIKDIELFLFQNSKSDVQIDVAIEVPVFDTHTGNHAGEVSDGQIFQDNQFNSYSSGFFAGALVYFSNIAKWGIVDTFDAGEFILESSVGTIPVGEPFRIFPAQSQRTSNDTISPDNNSGLFGGFLSDGGTNKVIFSEHDNIMQPFDCFYVWVKRTLTNNAKLSSDTGAILSLRYTDDADDAS